eukprot:1185860-Prorocentrum_minimum.AAC.2
MISVLMDGQKLRRRLQARIVVIEALERVRKESSGRASLGDSDLEGLEGSEVVGLGFVVDEGAELLLTAVGGFSMGVVVEISVGGDGELECDSERGAAREERVVLD